MSDEITIRTNGQFRDVVYWYELTEKERAEFDYLDSEARQEASFVRYRGWTYDLGEFMATRGMPEFSPLAKWDGYHSDSYFSGVLVRYGRDFERVLMATFYA